MIRFFTLERTLACSNPCHYTSLCVLPHIDCFWSHRQEEISRSFSGWFAWRTLAWKKAPDTHTGLFKFAQSAAVEWVGELTIPGRRSAPASATPRIHCRVVPSASRRRTDQRCPVRPRMLHKGVTSSCGSPPRFALTSILRVVRLSLRYKLDLRSRHSRQTCERWIRPECLL